MFMMRRRIAYVFQALLLAATTLSAGCGDRDHAANQNVGSSSPVLATVGQLIVRADELQRELELLPPALRQGIDEHQLRKKILRQLIRRRALAQQAIRTGLDLEPAVRWKLQRLRESVLVDELHARFLKSLPEPGKDEIDAYFRAHSKRYEQPEGIKLRHWVSKSHQEAAALWKKLSHQSSSQNDAPPPVSERWINVPELPEEWRKILNRLKRPGDLCNPVKMDEQWHIFQLLERRPASSPSPEDIRAQIIADMRHDQWERWVASLLEHQSVHVFQGEFEDVLHD